MFTLTERFIVLDTETTNSMDDPLVYDVGFAVININGTVYEKHSYVITETFFNDALMSSAYYLDKCEQYRADIASGKRKVKSFFEVWRIFANICKKYNVSIVLAHNARFDDKALKTTLRFLSNSKYRYFLPYNVIFWDTLRMARAALKDNTEYEMFCDFYGFLTSRGQLKFTAEVLYRFLSDNVDFIESHTGLEDVMIEKDIFVYCIAVIPEFDGRLWRD